MSAADRRKKEIEEEKHRREKEKNGGVLERLGSDIERGANLAEQRRQQNRQKYLEQEQEYLKNGFGVTQTPTTALGRAQAMATPERISKLLPFGGSSFQWLKSAASAYQADTKADEDYQNYVRWMDFYDKMAQDAKRYGDEELMQQAYAGYNRAYTDTSKAMQSYLGTVPAKMDYSGYDDKGMEKQVQRANTQNMYAAMFGTDQQKVLARHRAENARSAYNTALYGSDPTTYYMNQLTDEDRSHTDVDWYEEKIQDSLANGDYAAANVWMQTMIDAPLTKEMRNRAVNVIHRAYTNLNRSDYSVDAVGSTLISRADADMRSAMDYIDAHPEVLKEIESAYGIPASDWWGTAEDRENYIDRLRIAAAGATTPMSGNGQDAAFEMFRGGEQTWITRNATNAFGTKVQEMNKRIEESPTYKLQMSSYDNAVKASEILHELYNRPHDMAIDPNSEEARQLKALGVNLDYTKPIGYTDLERAIEETGEKVTMMGNALRSEGIDIKAIYRQRENERLRAQQEQQQKDVDEWVNGANWFQLAGASQLSVLAGLFSRPVHAVQTFERLANSGSTEDPYSYYPTVGTTLKLDATRAAISQRAEENGGALGKFFYDALMSAEDSALNTLILGTPLSAAGFATAGTAATLISMGASAAGSQANEILQRGGSSKQAITGGLAAGAIEIATEVFSVDKLIDASLNTSTLKEMLKNVGINSLTEGSEEVAGEILDIVVDSLNMGNLSENSQAVQEYMAQGKSLEEARRLVLLDNVKQVAVSGASGAVSGGMSIGLTGVKGYVNNNGGIINAARSAGYEIANSNIGQTVGSAADLLRYGEMGIVPQSQRDAVWQMQAAERTGKAGYGTKGEGALQFGQTILNTTGGEQAVLAYAKDNGIKARGTEVALDQKGQQKQARAFGQTAVETVNHMADKMAQGSTLDEARQVYTETVEKYGEGIKPAAQQALTQATERIATRSSGNVTDVLDNFKNAVETVKDAEVKDAMQRGLDSAVFRKAMSATDAEEKSLARQHMAQRGTSGMSMEATVKTESGEKTVGITGISEDGTKVKLADGSTASVTDLQTDADTRDILQAIIGSGVKGFANTIFQTYQNEVKTGSIADGYRWLSGYLTAFDRGRQGSVTLQEAQREASIDHETAKQAYELGERAAKDMTAKEREALDKKLAVKKKGATGRKGSVTIAKDVDVRGLSKEQKEQLEAVRKIAEVFGVDVEIFSSKVEGNKYTGENGSYLDGKIRLDINAGRNYVDDIGSGLLTTMSHELTHHIQQFSPETYAELKRFVLSQLVKSRGTAYLDGLIQSKIERSSTEMSRTRAEDEVVADAAQMVLTESQAIRQLANENPTLFRKVLDWVKGFFDKVHEMITGSPRLSAEARIMLSLEEDVRKAFGELWDRGVMEAARTNPGTENPATEGGEQFMEREIVDKNGKSYGMGVYMDSNLFTGLTEKERVDMFHMYLDEVSGQTFEVVGKNGTPVKVKIAESGRRFKNEKGNSVLVNDDLFRKYKRNHAKQEAVALIDQVFNTARFRNEEPAKHKHDWLDDNGSNQWQAFRTYMQEKNGTIYETILHIPTADTGELFLYDITPIEIKEVEQSGNSDTSLNLSGRQSGNSDTSPSNNKIAQSEQKVKPTGQNSDRDTEYLELAKDPEKNAARLQEMVDEAAREAGYPLKLMHGTNSFGFTTVNFNESDDKVSFFATDNEEVAGSYVRPMDDYDDEPSTYVRPIGKPVKNRITQSSSVGDILAELKRLAPNSYRDTKAATKAQIQEKVDEQLSYVRDIARQLDRFSLPERLQTMAQKVMEAKSAQVAVELVESVDDIHEIISNGMYFEQAMSNLDNLRANTNTLKKWAALTPETVAIRTIGNRTSLVDKNHLYDAYLDNTGLSGRGIYEIYTTENNPLRINCRGNRWNNIPLSGEMAADLGERSTTREISKWAHDHGYGMVEFDNVKDTGKYGSQFTPASTVYAFLEGGGNNFKSADAVTYDDNGDVIPLSKRFSDKNELRYSEREQYEEAVEASDVLTRYSLREEPAPQKTIKAYKAFYVKDGKLYPPMVSNNTNEEDKQTVKKASSGTMKGLETPVGVWLDADVGGIAVDENGVPLRTKTTGRLQVQNDKGGGTLAFRPGWHLGEWPDASQFNVKDPVTGALKSVMPDNLVFAECEIAADVDYQLEAYEYGISDKGGFSRTQAGLPRVPTNGYYKYRTNVDPTTAPWYITGAMKVTRILSDEERRQICNQFGVTPQERASHKDIDLEAYGLKAGPVKQTENLERFRKNKASYDNDALLKAALEDENYSNAYVRRTLDFDNETLVKEFELDRISPDQVKKYRESYQSPEVMRSERESAAKANVSLDFQSESAAPSDGMLFSERTWTASRFVQDRENAAKALAKALDVTQKQAEKYIDDINSVAKAIADDRARLDYMSSPGRSAFKSNAEYGGSIDFSTLCKKRQLLTGTFNAIQHALANTMLTAEDVLRVRQMMQDAGLEVNCGMCYVEGSRARMGEYNKTFLELYKKYFPDNWQPKMEDVNTTDGLELMRMEHPECYEQYEHFYNNHGTIRSEDKAIFSSQAKPKEYQLRTEYKGEIKDKFQNETNVDAKNRNGGMRMQSFSDFEIVHLIDCMQVIMDMSEVGLAGQAYTKVPEFAEALGRTGLKINLSLVAKGVDENGKLIFNDVEGMPHKRAFGIREKYSENVGTILVVYDDAQLVAAMADDKVDFIIPFHRSQWRKSQYAAMGLPKTTKDYTYQQNEKWLNPKEHTHKYRDKIVPTKCTNYMPNEYWDFSLSGTENARRYLEMCAKDGKRPKFYKLLQNNGDGSFSLKTDGNTDGYWKLLIDFKMYDNNGVGVPQQPVQPIFDMENAMQMLDDYSGDPSRFPVAEGIVDEFVNQYKAEHPGRQYSMREYDTPSDKDLMMQAAQADAANVEQGRLLKEYQNYGKKVQDLEVKLQKARAERDSLKGKLARRMLKTEATRDVKLAHRQRDAELKQMISDRNELAKRLQKQIQRYRDIMDGKLRTPELSKLLRAEREKAEKKVATHKDEVFQNYRERKAETELRNRIKNLHAEMNRDLLRPREGHFVPEKLIRPVVDLLDLVNTETNRAKSENAQARIDAINAAYDAIKKDERYSQFYDETVKDMLVELSGTLAGRSIYDLTTAELEDVYTVMKAMRTTIRNTIKADLIEKGREVWEIGNALRQELRSGRGAHANGLLEKYHMTMLSAKRAFNRFGGYMPDSTWNKVYRMLDDAQLRMLELEMQGTRIFDSVLQSKENVRKAEALTRYDEKSLVDVGLKDEAGEAVPITRGMMLALYMHLQNEENMRHLMYGGLTIPDYRRYYKGDAEAWGKGSVSIPALGARVAALDALFDKGEISEEEYDEAYRENKEEIDEILDSVRTAIEKQLTDYDRQWIAASKEFFDNFSRRELNRVTNEMYGFSKAKVDNYFPIVTDKNFLKNEFDSISRNISLENAGFMKERVRASNPILLEDITKTVNRQISNVSRYAGLTQALKTFGNVYNVQSRGFTDSVKKAMAKTYGTNGQKYVENLITDMIGGRNTPGTIFDKIKGNYAQAVLAANLSVTIKQAASYPTAAATVGWGPILKALVRGGKSNRLISRADRALIDTYTPLLWKRAQGAIDTEIGDIANGIDWTQRAQWLMGWIEKTDLATVGRLWYAAEYYVKAHYNLEKGTEAQIKNGESPFYRKVAEVFTDIVEDTQPNYTVLQRPDILRNPNKLVRAMVMFSTQRFQNGNILIDAIAEYNAMRRADKQNSTAQTQAARKAAKAKLTNAISSQVVSAVVLNVMTLVANAIMHRMNPWRDDDDEITAESIGEEMLNGFLSSMAGSFLAGSELYEAISSLLTGSKYYGNDVGGISTINELATAVVEAGQKAEKLIQDENSKPEDWKRFAEKQLAKVGEYLAQMTGVPIANINKIIAGGKNHIIDAMNGEFFSFEAGVERTAAVNARRYLKAWTNGDLEKVDAVESEMLDNYRKAGKSEEEAEKALKSKLTSEAKDAWTQGTLNEQDAIDFLTETGFYSADDAWQKVREWEDGKVKANFYEMLDSGASFDTAAADYLEHGFEEEDLRKNAVAHLKERYQNGDVTEDEAVKLLQEYGWKKENGVYRKYTEDEAWFAVQKWEAMEEHAGDETYSYKKYDAVYAAIDSNKDKDYDTALTELVQHGEDEEDVRGAAKTYITDKYKAGEITEYAFRNMLSRYCKITNTAEVNSIVHYADFQKQYPDSKMKQDTVDKYYTFKPDNYGKTLKEAGIPMGTYVKYYEAASQAKGTDKDGNGKTDSGSKKAAIMDIINGLNLTSSQKDALYYFNGWSTKTISEAPWH